MKPWIVAKKATTKEYIGQTQCYLCKRAFKPDEQFKIVEDNAPFDKEWYAVCRDCQAKPVYSQFIMKLTNQS